MRNVIFATADGLRAVGQIPVTHLGYPPVYDRAAVPAAVVAFYPGGKVGPEDVSGFTRRYRYVGKSQNSELHVYEEIV